MRRLYNDWLDIKEISQGDLLFIERDFETYMAKKFKEAFPNLSNDDAESYSRCEELPDNYPEAHRILHKELRERMCRNCKQSLPNKHYKCEGYFNEPVCLCEHCHGLILQRLWIEELYESISKELKGTSDTQQTQDDILSQ